MITVKYLTENIPELIPFEPDEAAALAQLGRELAGQRLDVDEYDTADTTVISVNPAGDRLYTVAVNNLVGTVVAGPTQIIVRPKIQLDSFVYLLQRSSYFPRLERSQTNLAPDESFFEVLVRWFLAATERLLRSDLIRDYLEVADELEAARGRIDALATARLFNSGRMSLQCEFEVFDIDTPLNRMIKAAARAIASNVTCHAESRRRAQRIAAVMGDVGSLNPSDARDAIIDRRTMSYADALLLGRQILAAQARALTAGGVGAQAFLIRTPEPMEDAIRNLLADGLRGRCKVEKDRLSLGGGMTLNPDLVFGGLAVGDVKYKTDWLSWPRPDLYQSVAFAAGFRLAHAVVVSFSERASRLHSVAVGNIEVSHLSWEYGEQTPPEIAEDRLKTDARQWWDALAYANEAVTSMTGLASMSAQPSFC